MRNTPNSISLSWLLIVLTEMQDTGLVVATLQAFSQGPQG